MMRHGPPWMVLRRRLRGVRLRRGLGRLVPHAGLALALGVGHVAQDDVVAPALERAEEYGIAASNERFARCAAALLGVEPR